MNVNVGTNGRAWMHLALLAAALTVALSGIALAGSGLWIPAKARLAQFLLERAFAQSVAAGHPVKPWSWADTWPVAKITVPRLNRSVIALDGASGQALAFGPGHLAGTPAPGEVGSSVFAAHRDTHFAFLGDLVPGDAIDVADARGRRFRYTVTVTSVVRWNASGIDPHAPGRHLVLTTCWPIGGLRHGPLRYIVRARLTAVRMSGDNSRIEPISSPPVGHGTSGSADSRASPRFVRISLTDLDEIMSVAAAAPV